MYLTWSKSIVFLSLFCVSLPKYLKAKKKIIGSDLPNFCHEKKHFYNTFRIGDENT